MKKQIILVLTLSTLLFTACEKDYVAPTPIPTPGVPPPSISSFYPESGAGGTVVAIFGANFGESISENYVTFNGMDSPVMQVQQGVITARVPMHLAVGDCQVNVSVRGQTVTSPKTFKVSAGSPTP